LLGVGEVWGGGGLFSAVAETIFLLTQMIYKTIRRFENLLPLKIKISN